MTRKIKLAATQGTFWFALLLAGYAAYAASFIARTSFVVDGERYFTLFDDAMISMRYAANLAHGFGLVWNPGGLRIEGYTNPLWVLYMAGWHLLPIPAAIISLPIQLTNALFLGANLFLVRAIALRLAGGRQVVALGAVALTAFYVPLANWSLQGMEVGPLTLLVSGAVWWVTREPGAGQRLWLPYLLLGVATLLRIDAVVPYLVVWLFLLATDPARRTAHLVLGLGGLLLFAGGQTAFRFLYYGDLLPNTYYLKMTGYPLGPRMITGLAWFGAFVWNMNPVLFGLALTGLRYWRNRAVLLLYLLFAGQVVYSIYVGGDAWEWWGGSNRYISPVMPLFMILLWHNIVRLVAPEETVTGPALPALHRIRPRIAAVALLTVLVVTLPFVVLPTPLIAVVAGGAAAGWLFLLRRRPGASFDPVLAGVLLVSALLNLNTVLVPAQGGEPNLFLRAPLHTPDDEYRVRQARAIQAITRPGATIAVVWAGIIPYFAGREAVDLLGKNDPVIAREETKPPISASPLFAFWPGHLKWDYPRTLGEDQPDVVVQLWPASGTGPESDLAHDPPDAAPYLRLSYQRVSYAGIPFYVRKNSSNVQWQLLGSAGAN